MRFIRLPWRIYRNHPHWVPPLIYERKRFLNTKKNPFFTNGEAEYFLAWRDGEPVGRISAQIDRDFNDFPKNAWRMFGFFEAEDDPEVAVALLDAAEAWLKDRGRDRMVGPMDFTMNDESGIVIEGHDLSPMIKQPYHPRYYQGLVEGAGLSKAMDLFMWNLEVEDRGKVLPIIRQLGWLKFLLGRRKIDRLRVGFLGVKPEYQHTGVAAAMWAEHFRMAAVKPQSGGEMGWILETNTAMNRAVEGMGGRIVKRYRVYERVFT